MQRIYRAPSTEGSFFLGYIHIFWLQLMLRSRPAPIMEDTMAVPPQLRNGSGMPVTGMTPMVMPMFSKAWKENMPARPAPVRVPWRRIGLL